MIVVDTKGATDCWKLYRLLLREKKYGSEFDPIDEPETDYYCDNDIYNVCFIPPSTSSAYYCLMQHICLILTYNASSRDSWDEVVAACERIRNRCKDAVLPFLTIMIAAIDEGETSVSHAEAEAFATQRDYLFIKFSPTTGRGICDTVGLVVELAYGARDQYTMDKKSYAQRYKRGKHCRHYFVARNT